MIMRTSSTIAATLIVVGMLTTVTSAQQVFFDDFDTNPPGPSGVLTGHEANTGQVWAGPIYGAADAEIGSGPGRGGTDGLAITSDPPSMSNIVPLNLTSGDITGGQLLWSVDSHRKDDPSGGKQAGLNNAALAAPGHPNWGWKNDGTSAYIETQGIFDSNRQTPVQMLTGTLHYEVLFDMDAREQTITWYDADDPTNPARSGVDGPIAFGDGAGSAGFQIGSVWVAGSGGAGETGWDNMSLCYGLLCADFTAPPPPTDFSWGTNGSGSWTTAGNWSPARVPGDPAQVGHLNHTATFGNAIESQQTVFTNTAVSVRAITFDNTNTYAVAGPGSVNLVLGTAEGPPPTAVTVNQGSHQFQAIVNLHNNTTVDVDSGATLEFINRLNLNGKTLTKTGDGTLLVNNSFNTGGGTIINNGGVIGGGGTIGGNMTNSGGTISPGNSVGLTTVVPEPNACILALLGSLGIAGYVLRCRSDRCLRQ